MYGITVITDDCPSSDPGSTPGMPVLWVYRMPVLWVYRITVIIGGCQPSDPGSTPGTPLLWESNSDGRVVH